MNSSTILVNNPTLMLWSLVGAVCCTYLLSRAYVGSTSSPCTLRLHVFTIRCWMLPRASNSKSFGTQGNLWISQFSFCSRKSSFQVNMLLFCVFVQSTVEALHADYVYIFMERPCLHFLKSLTSSQDAF